MNGRYRHLTSSRRGITLLEVLISMFVLAVGLLGVAALIPAGRHEVAQASRLEYASMIGRAAFRDLQVRGYLNPAVWRDANGVAVYVPSNTAQPFLLNGVASANVAFAIDPLGISANYGGVFPVGALSDRQLTRIAPINMTVSPTGAAAYMDTVFRSSVDLITTPNATNSDLPPQQKWFEDGAGAQLRRASRGDYSWLATIVSDPTRPALSGKVIVSVAVFHKRDLSSPGAGEHRALVELPPGIVSGNPYIGAGGGELWIAGLGGRIIRPGQWIALATRIIGVPLDYFRWYRVVSATTPDGDRQFVTLSGTSTYAKSIDTSDTQAYIFDNLVAVYEKTMSLEVGQ